MESFDRRRIKVLPISAKNSKTRIEDIAVNPDMIPARIESHETLEKLARQIIQARKNKITPISLKA